MRKPNVQADRGGGDTGEANSDVKESEGKQGRNNNTKLMAEHHSVHSNRLAARLALSGSDIFCEQGPTSSCRVALQPGRRNSQSHTSGRAPLQAGPWQKKKRLEKPEGTQIACSASLPPTTATPHHSLCSSCRYCNFRVDQGLRTFLCSSHMSVAAVECHAQRPESLSRT